MEKRRNIPPFFLQIRERGKIRAHTRRGTRLNRDAASLENFHFRVPSIGRMVAARRDQ